MPGQSSNDAEWIYHQLSGTYSLWTDCAECAKKDDDHCGGWMLEVSVLVQALADRINRPLSPLADQALLYTKYGQ